MFAENIDGEQKKKSSQPQLTYSFFAGRIKSSRGPHPARGPYFAHLCFKDYN